MDSPPPSSVAPDDATLLQRLARSGSDLEQLHRFEFVLRLPDQKAAQRAQTQLLGLAFDTTLERAGAAGDWRIRAAKILYPVESDLRGLRDKLEAIAAEHHGTYEGWSARRFVRAGS